MFESRVGGDLNIFSDDHGAIMVSVILHKHAHNLQNVYRSSVMVSSVMESSSYDGEIRGSNFTMTVIGEISCILLT